MTEIRQVWIPISLEEREIFLMGNALPGTEQESYLWFAVENAGAGIAYLFADELALTAEMARRAGLSDLATRLEDEIIAGGKNGLDGAGGGG